VGHTKIGIKDLIDTTKLQELTDNLYRATSIPSAVVAMDGEILTGSGWQRICTDFHRKHPDVERQCIESDTAIREGLADGRPYVIYRCPQGLVDASSPVVIEGEHLANVFCGQVFLEPGDLNTERFFKEQAARLGFDDAEYMAAFREVPVFTEDQFRSALEFLSGLAALLATSGLARLRELEAAQELRASEAKLVRSQHIARMGDFTWDIETGAATWSDGMFRLLRYDTSEEIDYQRVNSDIHHPDDLARVTEWLMDGIASGSDELRPNEYRLIRGDGETIYVRTSARVERDGDRAVRLVGTCVDVTDQRLAEAETERFRTISEQAVHGNAIADADGNLVYVNDYFARIHGYTADELVGKSLALFHGEEQLGAVTRINEELQREGSYRPTEVWHVHRDGTEFPMLMSGVMLSDGDGVTRYMAATAIDITESRRMEDELRKANNLESLGILAGGIAHDFNNILTGVVGNLDLLVRLLGQDRTEHEVATEAREAAIRATGLTRQLLTFAKGGAPVKQSASIEELIRETTERSLHGANTKPEYRFAADLPSVQIDVGQIGQVVQNLVLNADQAMPNGGILAISVDCVELVDDNPFLLVPGTYVRVSVADEGIGIPASLLTQVFDPYFSTKEAGHGLGLSICHSIVHRHNGHIDVASEQGVGTTFTFHIGASQEQPVAAIEEKKVISPGSGRILIMDDEETIHRVVGRTLRVLGYQVESVHDGYEALQEYGAALGSSKPFDLVIMDMTIPGGMGGKEAIGRLLLLDPDARAIVSSGYASDPVMTDFAAHGFVGRLPKPVELEELAEAVKRGLEGGG
jgi:two-component system, cell cycle sensor histidine kinase and response regulator CckA